MFGPSLQADHGSLLRRHQELVVLHSNAATQVTEVKTLRTEKLSLQTELDTTKTDLLAAEVKAKKGQELLDAVGTGAVEDDDVISLRRKLSTLETQMKTYESRATIAERRSEAHQKSEEAMQDHVEQLETQSKAMNEKMHEEVDNGDKLRRELEQALPAEQARRLQERLAKAEGDIESVKAQRDKYKDIAAIASKQAATIQSYAKFDAEVSGALRKAIVDLQAESEEKNIIAKLHMQIIGASLSGVQKESKADDIKQRALRDASKVLELEEDNNSLRSKLLRAHAEGTQRERSLERRLWNAREAMAGCVKMEQHEKATLWASRLQSANAELEKQMTRLEDQKVELEMQISDAILTAESDKKLKAYDASDQAIRDRGIKEMGRKNLDLRLIEKRLGRTVEKLTDRESYLGRKNAG